MPSWLRADLIRWREASPLIGLSIYLPESKLIKLVLHDAGVALLVVNPWQLECQAGYCLDLPAASQALAWSKSG